MVRCVCTHPSTKTLAHFRSRCTTGGVRPCMYFNACSSPVVNRFTWYTLMGYLRQKLWGVTSRTGMSNHGGRGQHRWRAHALQEISPLQELCDEHSVGREVEAVVELHQGRVIQHGKSLYLPPDLTQLLR